MKALLYDHPGGPDVLTYAHVADPQPGHRDVVVRVAAVALNRLDVIQRNGWYQLPGFTLPHIAGMDVAGTVIAVGAQADPELLDSRVVIDPSLHQVPADSKLAGRGDLYGELGVIGANVDGGYAELCLAPETHVHRIPDTTSWQTAAGFPTAWLTAYHALIERARLTAGETVLIHAAGSGVSTAAILLARQVGATVLATAGSDTKCAAAVALGADHAVNNRQVNVAEWAREITGGRGVDVVFDHVGPALFEASLGALAPRGRLVNCGNTSGDSATIPSLANLFHTGISIIGSDPYRYSEFAPAWHQYLQGGVQLPIDSIYPLADGAEAQERLVRNDVFGKILLEP